MAHKLPDEILKEMLSPTLKVPDEVFADIGHISPFASRIQSSSSVLVVCKKWLRVATPLLYSVVVLRSTAQAQALAHVLQANPKLGTFIRRLRVEGGFGLSMHKIIKLAPQITHLFLTLAIYSTDSVSGLCRAIPRMNPTHVILHDPKILHNSHVRRLVDTLCKCIQTWENLKIFTFPYEDPTSHPVGRLVADALCKTQHLEVVYAPLMDSFPPFIVELSEKASLKRIEMMKSEYRARRYATDFIKSVNEHPRLREIVIYEDEDSGVTRTTQMIGVAVPIKPSFVPMESAPECVRNKIWGLVVEKALFEGNDDQRQPDGLKVLPLVSKTFNKLVTSVIYAHPVISSYSSLYNFAVRLLQNPLLGLHIRTLRIRAWELFYPDNAAWPMNVILTLIPNLVRLDGMDTVLSADRILDWEGFEKLATKHGSTLVALNGIPILRPWKPQSPSLFNSFTCLRSLDWGGMTKFVFDPDQISPTCFSTLQSIRLRFCDPSFIAMLSYMDLPSLTVLSLQSLSGAQLFLEKHGPKLLEVTLSARDYAVSVLDLLPNLTLLTFDWIPELKWLQCKTEHKTLRKIAFDDDRTCNRSAWLAFFRGINWRPFPAMRELQLAACVWPLTEREIAKDIWHVWAEEVMKYDIVLTNGKGETWKPRLQKTL